MATGTTSTPKRGESGSDGMTLLFKGGQGTVFHGTLRGAPVAIKRLPLSSKRAAQCETAAAERLASHPHPHIVSYLAHSHDSFGNSLLYTELGVCDLQQAGSHSAAKRLGESSFLREWMLQVAHALAHCHAHGVAHRDVKPENVLLFRTPAAADDAVPSARAGTDTSSAGGAAGDPAASPVGGASLRSCTVGAAGSSAVDCAAPPCTPSHEATSGGTSLEADSSSSLPGPHAPTAAAGGASTNSAGPVQDRASAAADHSGSAALEQHAEHKKVFMNAVRSAPTGGGDVPPGANAAVDALHAHVARLCDFGCAVVGEAGTRLVGVSGKGSVLYAAPEVFLPYIHVRDPGTARSLWPGKGAPRHVLEGGYDACKADVWSFGVSLLVLATGKIPFRAAAVISRTFRSFVLATQPHVLQQRDILIAPQAEQWSEHSQTASCSAPSQGTGGVAAVPVSHSPEHSTNEVWTWPRGFSPALKHLLRGCLAVRPAERFSMEQVKAHPWFGDPQWQPPAAASAAGRQLASAAATAAGAATASAAAAVAAASDTASDVCSALFSAASRASSGTEQQSRTQSAAEKAQAPAHSTVSVAPVCVPASYVVPPTHVTATRVPAHSDADQGATGSAATAAKPSGAASAGKATTAGAAAAAGPRDVPPRPARTREALAPLSVPGTQSPMSPAAKQPSLPQRVAPAAAGGVQGGGAALHFRTGLFTTSSGSSSSSVAADVTDSLGGVGCGTPPAAPTGGGSPAVHCRHSKTGSTSHGLSISARSRAVAVSVHGPLLSPGRGGAHTPKPLMTPLPALGLGAVTALPAGGSGSASSRGPLAPRKGMVFSFGDGDISRSGRRSARAASRNEGEHGVFLFGTHGVPSSISEHAPAEQVGSGGKDGSSSQPLGHDGGAMQGVEGGDESKLQEHALGDGRGSARSDSPPTPSARSSPSSVGNPAL